VGLVFRLHPVYAVSCAYHLLNRSQFLECVVSTAARGEFVLPTGQVSVNSVLGGLEAGLAGNKSIADLCIIGDGARALAVSNLVSSQKILIYSDSLVSQYPSLDKLQVREYEVRERGAGVGTARGAMRGDLRNSDRVDEIRKVDGIFIATDTTKYGAIIDNLASGFNDGQTVCLVDAPLGAALEFKHLLKTRRCNTQLNIIETGKIFDSAKVESNVLLISGLRNRISVCGLERNETRRGLAVAQALKGRLIPCSNVIERGLMDVERMIRPAILLPALLGLKKDAILEPADLITPGSIKMLASVEAEVQQLAKAFQCVVPSFAKSLQDLAVPSGKQSTGNPYVASMKALFNSATGGGGRQVSLEDSLGALGSGLMGYCNGSTACFQDILIQDVLEVLTLLVDLGQLSRSPVGVINSIVEMSSVLVGENLDKHGRKAESLGLVGFDPTEIVDFVNH